MSVFSNALVKHRRALFARPFGYLLFGEGILASDHEPKPSSVPCVRGFRNTHIGGNAGSYLSGNGPRRSSFLYTRAKSNRTALPSVGSVRNCNLGTLVVSDHDPARRATICQI
jgi:hypothetical protein